jgi:hypothetical protein
LKGEDDDATANVSMRTQLVETKREIGKEVLRMCRQLA